MTAPPQPPSLPDISQYLSLHGFLSFWQNSTYGLFIYVVAGLMVSSIYLKTRSVGLTVAAAIILMLTTPMLSWLSIPVALGLSYLIYRSIYRRSPYS